MIQSMQAGLAAANIPCRSCRHVRVSEAAEEPHPLEQLSTAVFRHLWVEAPVTGQLASGISAAAAALPKVCQHPPPSASGLHRVRRHCCCCTRPALGCKLIVAACLCSCLPHAPAAMGAVLNPGSALGCALGHFGVRSKFISHQEDGETGVTFTWACQSKLVGPGSVWNLRKCAQTMAQQLQRLGQCNPWVFQERAATIWAPTGFSSFFSCFRSAWLQYSSESEGAPSLPAL